MSTFVEYLEELADTERTITIPAHEVNRLVGAFGGQVRHMGRWNVSGDGSLEIPLSVIWKAAAQMENRALSEAVRELKAEQFTRMLESSAAVGLIDKIAETYRRHFRDLMERYQSSSDPIETTTLRDRLVKEVFGS